MMILLICWLFLCQNVLSLPKFNDSLSELMDASSLNELTEQIKKVQDGQTKLEEAIRDLKVKNNDGWFGEKKDVDLTEPLRAPIHSLLKQLNFMDSYLTTFSDQLSKAVLTAGRLFG